MSIAPYLKEIGRGKEGARSLSREQAAHLMARLLDGQVSDVERGAFALAMRIKGETPQELAGFLDAVQSRGLPLDSSQAAIVLPSYNGARKLPNLTPLLACLLAREAVPVLVHGPLRDPARVTSAEIFEAMGLAPVNSTEQIQARWSQHQAAFVDITQLHPSLSQQLLALRPVLGLRNPGHTLAKLLPALTGSLRVVNYTHPEYAQSLSEFLAATSANALLMRGTEGEPVADARRLPAMKAFISGQLQEDLSNEVRSGALTELPVLPDGISAAVTAEFIQSVLAGQKPVPAPIQQQVSMLLALRQRMTLANDAPSSGAPSSGAPSSGSPPA